MKVTTPTKAPPKFVKRPISLPPELHDFVMERAIVDAARTGREPNFSGALSEIVAEVKRHVGGKKLRAKLL